MHATQRQENIWQYEGQIWNQLEKLQLEVSVWPYFYSFLDYHKCPGVYSTVPNISPYTIIKFLEGSKYQDGTKYIFWTSKYKFWPK